MRAQVVNYKDGLPPVEQVTIVNEHLLREPSWQNEIIFGPQGILDDDGGEVLGEILLDASSLSDVHGDRFQRLWQRYKHDMSGKTWAGNAEMAALKTLYSVTGNIVVWQISSAGIAHQVNRIDAGQAKTMHLRWVNELQQIFHSGEAAQTSV